MHIICSSLNASPHPILHIVGDGCKIRPLQFLPTRENRGTGLGFFLDGFNGKTIWNLLVWQAQSHRIMMHHLLYLQTSYSEEWRSL